MADRIEEIYQALGEEGRASLLDFAEYLLERHGAAVEVTRELPEPEAIERPSQETVVGAIKRLKQTYPMIESMSIFSAASSLMTDHMVKGRDAMEVIDEMEQLFEQAYQEMVREFDV